MKAVVRAGWVVAMIGFAAACGDSNGPGSGPVALFTFANYVDYDTSDGGSEASQLEFTLKSFGVTVTQVNAIDSTTLATALHTSGAFVVPEAGGGMAADLSAGAKTVLRRFVDSSGGVLIIVPDDGGKALLDTLFGYAIADGTEENTLRLNTAAAAGTPFAGGPTLIFDNNGTYFYDPASLPPAGKAVYVDSTNVGGAVAYIPQGRGVVVLIGWDWYEAAPHGAQDNGWLEVLRRALRS